MASTHRHTSAYAVAARALILLAMSTTIWGQDFGQMTSSGCYSSSAPLKNEGDWKYQSLGYCQDECAGQGKPVFGVEKAVCWCGDELPALSAKVDDDKCNSPCQGFPSQICGGNGYWSVYLSGIKGNVGHSGSSSADSTPTGSGPTVVTHVSPGKTVIVTEQASSGPNSSGSHGTNGATIAAGVIVAVVIVSGLIGAFFFIRRRRQMAAEAEFNRNTISEFMREGERKAPATSWSSFSDSRLDPEFGKNRNSRGSIADNEDFSRKILRVANPDRS